MSLLLDTTFNRVPTQHLANLKAQWAELKTVCKDPIHDECNGCNTVEKCGICLEKFQGKLRKTW